MTILPLAGRASTSEPWPGYTLISKTAGRASAALERGEEWIALRTTQLTAHVPLARPRAGR